MALKDVLVMQGLQDGDLGNSKSENLPPEKSISSHHNLQTKIIENQMDTVKSVILRILHG